MLLLFEKNIKVCKTHPRFPVQSIPDAPIACVAEMIITNHDVTLLKLPPADLAFWNELEGYVAIVDAGRKKDE
jgi:hypothetical protein